MWGQGEWDGGVWGLTMMCRSSWVGPEASKLSRLSAERLYTSLVPATLYSPGQSISQLPLMTYWERPFCSAGDTGNEGLITDVSFNIPETE